jgi:hypothetical protein
MKVKIKGDCVVLSDWEMMKHLELGDAEKLAHDILDELQFHRTQEQVDAEAGEMEYKGGKG